MKTSKLLAFTFAAMFAAGSAFACPKKNKDKSPGDSAEEGVYEVVERDGEKVADGERKRPERGDRERRGGPFMGLEMSDDQKARVKDIMEGAKEASKAIFEEAKAKKEAGEEVDREAVRESLHTIRKNAFQEV